MFYIYLKTLKVTIVREYLWFVAVLQLNVGFTMFIYQTWKYFNKILLFQRKLWQYWKANFTANFTSSNFSQVRLTEKLSNLLAIAKKLLNTPVERVNF